MINSGAGSSSDAAVVKQEGLGGRRSNPFWAKVKLSGNPADPSEYLCQEPDLSKPGGICGCSLHPGSGASAIKRHFQAKHKRTFQEISGYLDDEVVDAGSLATDGIDIPCYLFDFSPLVSTSATLGEVLQSCKKMESADNKKGRPIGWAAMCVHVDDCPGVSSSDRLTDYIKAGIMVQYECKHGPWKKVLGFKFTCTDDSVTMSAEHTIETMYNTYLVNHPSFDARMPGRDVTLTVGEPSVDGDPRLSAYKEMQTETRSLLGLLLWVSLAYPQISYHVNRACGFMSNPSHGVNAYAKQIALHLYQYPVAVKWGGSASLELSSPSPPPTLRPSLQTLRSTGCTSLLTHRLATRHAASQAVWAC